jgi:TM2 domain-containing membrane protein YozV
MKILVLTDWGFSMCARYLSYFLIEKLRKYDTYEIVVLSDRKEVDMKKKSKIACLLLCLFIGQLGIHRFYVGKIGTGILFILTIGGLGIWRIVDICRIITGGFKTKDGHQLVSGF